MSEISTVGMSRDEVIARCKVDLNFFAAICLPDVYRFPFPPIFVAVWQMLTDDALKESGQNRIAIGLPRGFGKTILLKLYAAWLNIYSTRQFILVVCNTQPLASNFIADVEDIMDSPNIKKIWGDWRIAMDMDNAVQKKYTFCGRSVTMAALGNGGSPRGLNIKFVRPDAIIMDDMQSREEAESPVVAMQLLTWMLGTLMKANNKFRCQFTFVGNMYPFDGSILKKLKNNPAWYSFICGAILADGQSIWPELRSVEDILEELENDTSMGHPEIFFSEVMNDEDAGNKAGIDISKIGIYEEPPEHLPAHPESGFVIIDPSVGKKKSDAVAIGAILFFDGEPVLWDISVGAFDPMTQILESFRLAMLYGISVVLIESVAYQATLAFWMNYVMKQRGLTGLRALEIYPGVSAKNSRILEMLKQLTAPKPRIRLHPRVKTRFVHETVAFNPARTKNVDNILDLAAYAYPAQAQFGAALLLPMEAMAVVTKSAFGDELETTF